MGPPVRHLTGAELHATLPLRPAIDALAAAFAALPQRPGGALPRSVAPIPPHPEADDLLVMPAVGPEGAGAKIVTIARSNPARGLPLVQGVYVLFAPDTLAPELTIDAAALTTLRTAAVSALATRCLARPDSTRLVVFGAGAQAQAHVAALSELFALEQITVIGPSATSARAGALVERLGSAGAHARIGVADDVRRADLVCTCTTATAPLFDGAALAPGAHVNAVGAYRPDMCELDGALLARALRVVETRAAALAEAGDLIRAIAAGALPADAPAHELSEVVSGRVGRHSEDQITVFKSVGLALEDLVLARAAAERLRPPNPVAVATA